jgi:hypothetical protein
MDDLAFKITPLDLLEKGYGHENFVSFSKSIKIDSKDVIIKIIFIYDYIEFTINGIKLNIQYLHELITIEKFLFI